MSKVPHHQLAQALSTKIDFVAVTEQVAINAEVFYKNHLESVRISKAQMAAIGAYLRRADTLKTAVDKCTSVLKRQMIKLEKREANGARPTSWRKCSQWENKPYPVGEITVYWFEHGCYLPNGTPPTLPLLQYFWQHIEILYHFHAVTQKPATLHKEIRHE